MNDELRELRARLRRFIDSEVIPAEPAFFEQQEETGYWKAPVLDGLRESAKAQGLWALGHPKEIGGGGVSFMDFVYLNEVIGRSELAQFAVGSASMQDSHMFHLYGTDEQKERWLAPMVRGEIFPSVGLTEPEVAGSDPTLMQSKAHFDGDEIVVNAHKWFTSGANNAAFTTVFAETDPGAPTRHRRFSAIIVPTDTPGYRIERVVPTMGHVGGGHCEVRIEEARVPAGNLLGERGAGFVIAQRRLGPGRIFHCMRWLGQAQRAFDLMCERATTRYAHGSLLSEKGEIQRYIAESAAEIQGHRLMTLDAASRLDAGDDARVEIALIKFHGAQMLHNVIDRAIQVYGAKGLTSDTPLERMYREARYGRIYDGPDEVHRMSVARRLLKDSEQRAVGMTTDAVPVSLDPGRVAAVLSPVFGSPVEVVELRRLSAGASRLSWYLDVRSGGALHRLVLQRERGQGLGRGGMPAEAALLRAAAAAGVPVPSVVAAAADPAALGGAYLVTERVDGETIPRRILRDAGLAGAGAGFAAQCGQILTRIHAIPVASLPDLPRPDPLDAITVMLDNTGQSRPAFEIGLSWLREHPPRPRPATLVHGDFRNGNLVVGPDGIRAVLDWELAHVGNPMQDLGWLCARPWRWGASAPVGGIGRTAELLAAYSPAYGPVTGSELFWWKLLSSVRWGVMCLEQARVHLSGEQRSVELAVLGRLSSEMEYDVLRTVRDAE